MTKYERFKLWVSRNQDKILVVGISTVVVGLVVIAVKANMEYQDQARIEFDGYIDDLNEAVNEARMQHELEELTLMEEEEILRLAAEESAA